MNALETLSNQLDAAARREQGQLHEMDAMRSEMARMERHIESLHEALWEQTRLVDEFGSAPAKGVAE